MKKRAVKNHYCFPGSPILWFDRLMSGGVGRAILWMLLLSAALFFALLGIFRLLGLNDFNIFNAFVMMSNPGAPASIESGTWLETIGVILFNIVGIFALQGLVVTIFVNWVSARRESHENGSARYAMIHKHGFSVIIGGHKMVPSLAVNLINRPENRYILIQTQRPAELLRKEILAEAKDAEVIENIFIYSGDRTSWHQLEDLYLGDANEIYIIGESHVFDGTSHDAISMQCWNIMNCHIAGRPDRQKIPCHIMFEYQSTFSAFQISDMKVAETSAFRFIPFSIYETWAEQVFVRAGTGKSKLYIPLDGPTGIKKDSPQRVHLIIAGMSKMGMALALKAAHLAHYPNFSNKEAGNPRTLITFIDRNAGREMYYFMSRYRALFEIARWRFIKAPAAPYPQNADQWKIFDTTADINSGANKLYPWKRPALDPTLGSPYCGEYLGGEFVDIDFEFIEGDIAQPSIQKYITDACADCDSGAGLSKTTLAVCFPVAVESMSAAMYFHPSVYKNAQEVLVYQPESDALVTDIMDGVTGAGSDGEPSTRFRNIRAFGMVDKCEYLQLNENYPAKVIAYVYSHSLEELEYLNKYKTTPEIAAILNKYWQEEITNKGGKSAMNKKWSNIYSAQTIITKLRCVDPTDPDRINILGEIEHNRWDLEQLLAGFTPISREDDARYPDRNWPKKEKAAWKSEMRHVDIRAYDQLTEGTKDYDRMIAKALSLALEISKKLEQNHYDTYD